MRKSCIEAQLQVTVLQLFSLLQLHPVSVTCRKWVLQLPQSQWAYAFYLDGTVRQKEVEAGATLPFDVYVPFKVLPGRRL